MPKISDLIDKDTAEEMRLLKRELQGVRVLRKPRKKNGA